MSYAFFYDQPRRVVAGQPVTIDMRSLVGLGAMAPDYDPGIAAPQGASCQCPDGFKRNTIDGVTVCTGTEWPGQEGGGCPDPLVSVPSLEYPQYGRMCAEVERCGAKGSSSSWFADLFGASMTDVQQPQPSAPSVNPFDPSTWPQTDIIPVPQQQPQPQPQPQPTPRTGVSTAALVLAGIAVATGLYLLAEHG